MDSEMLLLQLVILLLPCHRCRGISFEVMEQDVVMKMRFCQQMCYMEIFASNTALCLILNIRFVPHVALHRSSYCFL